MYTVTIDTSEMIDNKSIYINVSENENPLGGCQLNETGSIKSGHDTNLEHYTLFELISMGVYDYFFTLTTNEGKRGQEEETTINQVARYFARYGKEMHYPLSEVADKPIPINQTEYLTYYVKHFGI